MITRLKLLLKSLLAKYTPLALKKSLLSIWQHDDEFWLHCKVVCNGNDELYKNRFLWKDLTLTIQTIRERFGINQIIYLLTDRADYPQEKTFQLVDKELLFNLADEGIHVVICAYESDEKLLEVIEVLNTRSNIFYFCPFRYIPTARYFHRNDTARVLLTRELELNLGKFDLPDFENIIQALEMTRKLEGSYVEIGVYKGDSAHVALEYMKVSGIKRKSYFFDLFEGFTNVSSERSNDAVWLNSHTDTSLSRVELLLKDYENIVISKLDIITDELPPEIKEIVVCNIDVDLFEAVKSALTKVHHLVKRGGVIILEDQGHTPFLAGAFVATINFLKENDYGLVPIQMTSGQMFLIKT